MQENSWPSQVLKLIAQKVWYQLSRAAFWTVLEAKLNKREWRQSQWQPRFNVDHNEETGFFHTFLILHNFPVTVSLPSTPLPLPYTVHQSYSLEPNRPPQKILSDEKCLLQRVVIAFELL